MNLFDNIPLQLHALAEILLAMFLSGMIGFEREAKERTAGIRTMILVGGAAALFTILGEWVTRDMLHAFGSDVVKADAVRVTQAVITGLAFLGAGAILRPNNQKEVVGLTTSASLLFVGGIGVTVASGAYILAVGATILALIVLHGLHFLERKIGDRDR